MNDYLNQLSTIAGLGFVAVLTNKTFVSMYQERLETFIRHSDFMRKPEESIPLLSRSIAEMIDMASRSSYAMNQTIYADYFCVSLKKVLSHISIDTTDQEFWINRLLVKTGW